MGKGWAWKRDNVAGDAERQVPGEQRRLPKSSPRIQISTDLKIAKRLGEGHFDDSALCRDEKRWSMFVLAGTQKAAQTQPFQGPFELAYGEPESWLKLSEWL